MKNIIVLAALSLSYLTLKAQVESDSAELNPNVQVSLIYPIGSGGADAAYQTYDVSVNIFAGLTGGVDGVEFSGFAGFTKGAVTGAQVSGFVNVVADTFKGLQIAGFSNVVRKDFEGLQVGGFTNTSLKNHDGAQIAGFANYTGSSLQGAQVGGFVNTAIGSVEGFQGAGFVNYSMGLAGAQVAGFVNTNIGEMKGNQIAGFVNVSTGVSEGLQVSGFVNFARKLKGAQLGFINVADSLDGVAVGFFSYAKNGYHQFEVSANETFQTNLSFKTGTNMFYNVFSVAAHWNQNDPVWAFGYGIGTRKEFGNQFSMNAELNSYAVLPDNFEENEWESLNKLKLSFAKGLGSHVELFAGVSFNMWVSQREEPMHDYLYSTKYRGGNGDVNWIMYPGFHAGIRI